MMLINEKEEKKAILLTPIEMIYLKEIWNIKESNEGSNVNLVILAQKMGVSVTFVREIVNKLKKKGLIVKKWNNIEFDKKGEKIIKNIVTKRRIVEDFFYFILGLNEITAKKEANKLDYLVCNELVIKMKEYLEKKGHRSAFCIHGKRKYFDYLNIDEKWEIKIKK